MGAFRVRIGGIGCRFRRLGKYTDPISRWMRAVGTAPIAGGARAPISDILSHLGAEVQKLRTLRVTLRLPMISTTQIQRSVYIRSCSRYRDMGGRSETTRILAGYLGIYYTTGE